METMEPTESKESLEELFEQLGNILADMENPELSLEDAFMLYEQGMKKMLQSEAGYCRKEDASDYRRRDRSSL